MRLSLYGKQFLHPQDQRGWTKCEKARSVKRIDIGDPSFATSEVQKYNTALHHGVVLQ